MKTLYIHIGYHKTATTSIQQFLTNNVPALRIQGINYASCGLAGTSHSDLANCLKPENKNRPQTRQLWSRVLQEVSESECPATLISSECFLESKGIPSVLAPMLHGNVQVRIICYLRPQLEWLESVYNEVVKDPYRRYTGDVFSLREVQLGWIDYHDILKLWSDEFGPGSMCVRPFEKVKLKNGSIYDDFLDSCGVASLPSAVMPENQNLSLHPSLTEFLRRCNTLPMLNLVHANLTRALQEISTAGSVKLPVFVAQVRRISEEQLGELLPRFNVCNVALGLAYRSGSTTHSAGFFEFVNDSGRRSLDENVLLPPEVEHLIFNQLPQDVRSHLESVSDQVAQRIPGRCFLPLPVKDMESRLRAVIIRQRIEARDLYSRLEGVSRIRKWILFRLPNRRSGGWF